MYDFGSALLGFDYIGESNWMGFCHITAHDQYGIAIHKVLRKCRGAATSQGCTQTGYRGTVSYTGLILNRDNTKTPAEELLHQIILFDIQGSATKRGYAQGMVDLPPIR